jgi:hypothetical protein
MGPRPKPEKNPLFAEAYWKRPDPRDKGDASPDAIAMAVGHTLSKWELADQALSKLFLQFCEVSGPVTYNAVRRAYGSIESNSGRRNAVLDAAEVYFGAYWTNKFIQQSVKDIINAVQWASKRRDDIAHGVIWGNLILDGVHYGSFLMPPDYNTGRSHAFMEDSTDPLRFTRAKYRYTSADISPFFEKFSFLRNEIDGYIGVIRRVDGRFPALEAAIEPLMDEARKKK